MVLGVDGARICRGVGVKVADCVALYGLGYAAAWPVDTHLLQHAIKDKAFHKFLSKCKALPWHFHPPFNASF